MGVISPCCYDKTPNKSEQRKGGFVVVASLRVLRDRELRRQECKVTLHTAFIAKKQTKIQFGIPAQGMIDVPYR